MGNVEVLSAVQAGPLLALHHNLSLSALPRNTPMKALVPCPAQGQEGGAMGEFPRLVQGADRGPCQGYGHRKDALIIQIPADCSEWSFTARGGSATAGVMPSELRITPAVKDDPVSIEEALEVLLKSLRDKADGERHIKEVAATVHRACRLMGWVAVGDLTPSSAQAWIDRLRGTCEPKTIELYRSCLERVCAVAVRKGWLPACPFTDVEAVPVPEKEARVVPEPGQLERFILAPLRDWRTHDRWLIYLTQPCTGLRAGGITHLRRDWLRLDEEHPYVHLPPGADKNARRIERAYMPLWLAPLLRAHLDRSKGGDHRRWREGYVFAALPGRPNWLRDAYAAGLARWEVGEDGRKRLTTKRADGATFSAHSLRHYFGGWLHRLNCPDRLWSIAMRHASPGLKRRYTGSAREAVWREVGGFVSALPPLLSAESQTIFQKSVDRTIKTPDTPGAEDVPMVRNHNHLDAGSGDHPAADACVSRYGFSTIRDLPQGGPPSRVEGLNVTGGGTSRDQMGATGLEPVRPTPRLEAVHDAIRGLNAALALLAADSHRQCDTDSLSGPGHPQRDAAGGGAH